MSAQQCAPRTRSSPKQGPLRATMPISSVTKEGSTLRPSFSPIVIGPPVDHSLGRRSPGAGPFKEAQRTVPRGIRRTASLDAIYLKGLFPREGVFWQRDRSTQTEHSHSLDSLAVINTNNGFLLEDKLARLCVKPKRKSPSRDSSLDQTELTGLTSSHIRSSPSPSSFKSTVPTVGFPLKSSRSSDEGLNKEIESYISKSDSDPQCDRVKQPTPEGRKAPVADLLREVPYLKPFIPGARNSPEDSQGSSPDQDRMMFSSPRINNFSARAPPDGCERVLSKSVPILRPVAVEATHPNSLYTLKQSSHSAFQTLSKEQPKTEDKATETDRVSPLVPENEDADDDNHEMDN